MVMTIDFSALNGTEFALGTFGAFCVETYRFKTLSDRGKISWHPSKLFPNIVWVLTFLIASGVLAAVLGVSAEWSALYTGLTSPVFFGVILKDNTQAQRELEELQQAYAQANYELEELRQGNTQNQKRSESQEIVRIDSDESDVQISPEELIEHIKKLYPDTDVTIRYKQSGEKGDVLINQKTLSDLKKWIREMPDSDWKKLSDLTWDNEKGISPYRQLESIPRKNRLRSIIIGTVALLVAAIVSFFFLFTINVGYELPEGPPDIIPSQSSQPISPITILLFIIALLAALALLFWVIPRIYRKARKSQAFQTFLSGLV